MKCPKCDGKGTVLKIIYEDWKKDEIVRSAVKCPRCNGSGEVEQTNEEHIRGCHGKELANTIFCAFVESATMIGCSVTLERFRTQIELTDALGEWLKQPHPKE